MTEKLVHECSKCGATSEQTPVISFVYNGQVHWICVHCLPALIHG